MYFSSMKNIFIFCLLLLNTAAFSQVRGLTDDGKEVVLFDNGTWKFVNESDAKTLETIMTNDFVFKKNKDATSLMRSKKMDVGVYFNPEIWKASREKIGPYVEYMFRANSEDQLVGLMITEKIQIKTLKNLKDILLTSVQKSADYFRLKESEYRNVNGLKILYLRYIANTKGLDFEYVANYYLSDFGYCGIVAFASQSNFDKNSTQLQDLLNGISFAKKEEVSEVIYTSPPPPMRPK